MLIDRIHEADEVLARQTMLYAVAVDTKQKSDQYEAVIKISKMIRYQIVLSDKARELLVPDCGMTESQSKSLMMQLNQIRSCLRGNADISEYLKNLSEFAISFTNGENMKWQEKMKFVAKPLFELLQQFKSVLADSSAADKIASELNNGMSGIPSSIKEIEQYQKSIEKAKSLTSQINASLPIRIFIQKLSQHRATMTDLNDEVIEWIHSQGIESKIKLSI